MQKFIRTGSLLTSIVLLVLTLACGASLAAIQQRVVPAPRLSLELAGYRVVGSPVTIRGKPPKYFYSIWLFVSTYDQASAVRTEKGEQIMMLPLRSN